MKCAVAYDDDFLCAGPMARPHLVSTGCLRLGRLNAFLRRRNGRRRGRILSEGRRAQTESGDSSERQHKLIHDVLLGDDKQIVPICLLHHVTTLPCFPNYKFHMYMNLYL